jgi:predicted transcriptional regulator
MTDFKVLTRHPLTGVIEYAEWLDDADEKNRYGVRFPSDGEIYGSKDCHAITGKEAADEIERLRAALEKIMQENGLYSRATQVAFDALAGEKTND